MKKSVKILFFVILTFCLILSVYVVKSDILQEIFKGNSEVIDTGWFNFTYRYNSTTQTMTNWDGLSFQTNQNGVITVKKDTGILSYFGFALTGKINGENQIKTSEDFTWTWSMKQEGDNYTFTAYNNYPNFNWTQIYYFYPDKPMKIKHILTNKLGVTIENTKMWYIHTIEENELIIFNNTEYKLNLTEDKHFQGNFDNLLPKIEMKDKYFFNYSDIIDDGFDITDIFIGNGSIVQHPNVYIIAVGFTKGLGDFPNDYKIEIDPTIETIESTNQVGRDSSIALDSNGIAHISYYGTTNSDLRYCNNSGGSWSCVQIEGGGIFGTDTSIAIDSNDIVHISSYNSTGSKLAYCNNSGGSWSCSNSIDDGGEETSIAIDSNNVVHISHYGTSTNLRYCNNSGGSWSCLEVNSDDRGGGTSIAIDSNNVVHIAHHINAVDGANLDYCNNSGGSWSCLALDTPIGYSSDSSIAIDSNDKIHISYIDNDNNNLRYCSNSGGTWSCSNIKTVDFDSTTSIAVGFDDIIHIATQNTTSFFLNYCNNSGGSWSCIEVVNTTAVGISFNGRNIATKKGRLSTSTSFSGYVEISYYKGSTFGDLMYAKIDTSFPLTNLSTPINNSWNNSLTIDFTCNSSLSLGGNNLKNVTLYAYNSTSVVNNTVNKSISGSTNSSTFQVILPRDDTYLWNCYTCDTDNNCAFADSNFTLNIDTTIPLISITFPSNNTNQSNNGLDINYTVSDTNLGSCWYSNDTFSSNTTLTCGTNITTITWSEGQHNVTIWANDSANNVNSSSVTFRIDTISPSVTIALPQSSTNYANNNSMSLNYSVSDITTSVSTCWYNVYLVSPYLIAISNTTITNCLNTTFSLQGGDEDYQLNFYANDTVNNINKTTFNFGIRTNVPAINLNYPANNQYFNNGTNVYFNFTATDSDNLSSCRLYGNWTGTWHINYTWISPNSGVMNYTTRNITGDAIYKWNVWCNDTLNNNDFSPVNRTFTIDLTNPEVNITTSNASTFTSLSLTINFNISDTNIDICYFTVRDSTGAVHNYAENTSISCSATSRAISTLVYGTFTFELWGEDLANNLNSDVITFTTTAPTTTTGGGGGGISAISEEHPVIALQSINLTKFSELERAIIFSKINTACEPKVSQTLAITSYYQQCSLSLDDLNKIIVGLIDDKITITSAEMMEFYKLFKQGKLTQIYTVRELIDKYDLVESLLMNPLSLSPSSIDSIFLAKYVLSYSVLANKNLQSCAVVSETPMAWCEISKNTTAIVHYNLTSLDFFSNIYSAKFSISSSGASSREIETKYISAIFRVYNTNFRNIFTMFLPIWVAIFIYSFVLIYGFYFLYKKRKLKKLRKLGEILG